MTRDQIREILLNHGFRIPEGMTDLREYVYEAAEALLAEAGAPEGWQFVPVEPTPSMVEAAFDALPNSPLEGRIRTHYRAMLAAAPTPPVQQCRADGRCPPGKCVMPAQQDDEAHGAAVSHLWECLGWWSANIAQGGELADLAPPSRLIDAINAATLPRQDDEVLEALRELIAARDEFTGAGDPQAIRSAAQRIRAAEKEARALLTKRGAV